MKELIAMITTTEWLLFGITFAVVIISGYFWRRAQRASQKVTESHEIESKQEDVTQNEELVPEVLLEISVIKNEFEQVSIELSNRGMLAAREVTLNIEKPEQIFDTEGLSGGIELANVTLSSVILPRLSVLDTDNQLPVKEILSGNSIELPAALTMAHGKICEFPVTIRWNDENGRSQQNQFTLTV